jgi:hypothetical protein
MSLHRVSIGLMIGSIVVAAIAAAPGQARTRGHVLSAQGAGGRGFTQSRSITRGPGNVSANRGLQTNSGRGYTSSRGASWADGSYSGGRTTTLNNGSSFGRSTTAINNGDGTTSFTTARTGLNGNGSSVSGTVSRPPQ